MIQSCFSQPNTPSRNNNNDDDHHHDPTPTQNLVTCVYQTFLGGSPTHLTLTWAKTLASHTLTVFAADMFSVTVSLRPSPFSLFRSNSRSIYLTGTQKLKLHWDFTHSKFCNSAEPESGFHLVIVSDCRVEFFLCDSGQSSSLLSRREHVFGQGCYKSSAVISGSDHVIGIECTKTGTLRVKVNDVIKLVVKRLAWKFRGNERISVDGVDVEFFWDVFNWVNGDGHGHGVFVFLVGDTCGVWPEMAGPEKRLLRKSVSVSTEKINRNNVGNIRNNNINNIDRRHSFGSSSSSSSSSVLQWAEESSDGGSRSSCSSSTSNNGGFSLMIYAWRKD